MNKEYKEGRQAYSDGIAIDKNPYKDKDYALATYWYDGYLDAGSDYAKFSDLK